MYRQLGEDARKNTLADASGLTGGLTNSYAIAASQQAQNDYNSRFTQDVIPQLMDLAYNRYANGANFELENLNSAQSLLSQIATADQNYLNNMYNFNRANRSDFESDRNFNEGVRQYDQNFDYQKERDKVADEQWLKDFEESVREYEKSYNLSASKASSKSSGNASSSEKDQAKQMALQIFNEVQNYPGGAEKWLNTVYLDENDIPNSNNLTNGMVIANHDLGYLVFPELLNLINTYKSTFKEDNTDKINYK